MLTPKANRDKGGNATKTSLPTWPRLNGLKRDYAPRKEYIDYVRKDSLKRMLEAMNKHSIIHLKCIEYVLVFLIKCSRVKI